MKIEVTLARVHWSVKSKAAKAYRAACHALTKEAKLTAPVTDGRLHLWLDFYPPDRRARDAVACQNRRHGRAPKIDHPGCAGVKARFTAIAAAQIKTPTLS